MFESKDGRVSGSIDRTRVAELLAATKDDELKAHYRDVLGESEEGKAADKAESDKPAKKAASASQQKQPNDKGGNA